MDQSARAIARTQGVVLEQQFYLSRQRPPVFSGDGNPTLTDRFRKAADMGTDDRAAAGDPFNRNKTKSLHASRRNAMTRCLAINLASSEPRLIPVKVLPFKRELPDSRHNSGAFWPVTHDRQSWPEACLAELPQCIDQTLCQRQGGRQIRYQDSYLNRCIL
jgi:hypothetical protein